jgi:acyl carrier protein
MNREEFLKGFQEQFEDTDESLITFQTKYKDLEEWSSMMALIIIAFIDENYSKSLSGDDFKNSTTIEELYQILIKNK